MFRTTLCFIGISLVFAKTTAGGGPGAVSSSLSRSRYSVDNYVGGVGAAGPMGGSMMGSGFPRSEPSLGTYSYRSSSYPSYPRSYTPMTYPYSDMSDSSVRMGGMDARYLPGTSGQMMGPVSSGYDGGVMEGPMSLSGPGVSASYSSYNGPYRPGGNGYVSYRSSRSMNLPSMTSALSYTRGPISHVGSGGYKMSRYGSARGSNYRYSSSRGYGPMPLSEPEPLPMSGSSDSMYVGGTSMSSYGSDGPMDSLVRGGGYDWSSSRAMPVSEPMPYGGPSSSSGPMYNGWSGAYSMADSTGPMDYSGSHGYSSYSTGPVYGGSNWDRMDGAALGGSADYSSQFSGPMYGPLPFSSTGSSSVSMSGSAGLMNGPMMGDGYRYPMSSSESMYGSMSLRGSGASTMHGLSGSSGSAMMRQYDYAPSTYTSYRSSVGSGMTLPPPSYYLYGSHNYGGTGGRYYGRYASSPKL